MEKPFVDLVYDTLVVGVRKEYRMPGVEYAFDDGYVCLELYGKALDAYRRLCDRLGVEDEDDDVEEIFSAFLEIDREIAYRMYRYGAEFGLNGERYTGVLPHIPTKEEILDAIMRGEKP